MKYLPIYEKETNTQDIMYLSRKKLILLYLSEKV